MKETHQWQYEDDVCTEHSSPVIQSESFDNISTPICSCEHLFYYTEVPRLV